MFESAETGHAISKARYKRDAPHLRTSLLEAQRKLSQTPLSVVVVVGGVEGAGKAETVNLLLEWMDARGIQVHALGAPSDEELERPAMWRYWRLLPPKGRIGIFFGSWYTAPIVDRVFGRIDDAEQDQALDRIVEFERMLTNEGTLVVKLWMHLSKKRQRARLRELASSRKQRWRVTPIDWKFFKRYEKFKRISERVLRRTSVADAPWTIVEATDARYRNSTTVQTLVGALQERLGQIDARPSVKRTPDRPRPDPENVLASLDLTQTIGPKPYEAQLVDQLAKVSRLSRRLHEQGRSLILVFEGPDAAGKGGAIRRITSAIDARMYDVISVAAPTDEERAHPYLWRFWRHLPRAGRVTIYDRSWYGRVLVERIEGFCARPDWQRAFQEINAFEEQLTESGVVLLKFWLMTSAAEQLRRFKNREATPYKQYKLTEEDWRNRQKWDAYVAAACDMIERCGTESAPWVLVEADDKSWARIKIMRAVTRALKSALR